ncbi:MAG: SpoIID/LytB domain-containing protein [Ruminococcus sp.]|nr:SpoIID/LytB domain-containing protein [Ruminococcus sp.]
MKAIIRSAVIWAALITALSAAAAKTADRAAEETESGMPAAAVQQYRNDCLTVLCRSSGEIRLMSAEEYAVFAVMGEIPFLLEEEALKAQVCAARTYALRRVAEGEDVSIGAHISDDGEKYQTCLTEAEAMAAYGDEYPAVLAAVTKAARDTEGETILYGGTPIVAAFHISSPEATESAENVWGKAIPYLVSVPNAENSPYSGVRKTFTRAEISARLSAEFGENLCFDGAEITEASPSGTALTVEICGRELTGERLARILSLNSAAFTVSCSGDTVTFTVNGCGHLAGMSIYGAQQMAENGCGYREILEHYYPGTYIARSEG